MQTPAFQASAPETLAGKLELLRRRLTRHGDTPPSTRDLASRATGEDDKPFIDHTVIHATLSGAKTNPPCRTILGLAQAFNCPPAYLLPGSDDLTSLEVYYNSATVRQALRLISDLGDVGPEVLLQAAMGLRSARGLPTRPGDSFDAPEESIPPNPRRAKRQRLPLSEAAQRSAVDLHGMYAKADR